MLPGKWRYSVRVCNGTLRILLSAGLGLLTTTAIAWMCAAFVEFSDSRPWETATLRQDGSMEWRLVQEAFGRARIAYVIGPPSPSGDPLHVPLMDAFSILRPKDAGSIEEAGWPFRALWCRSGRISIVSATYSAQITTNSAALEGGLALPDRVRGNARDWRALPYQPAWLGLMIDTVIFAGAWMAALFGLAPLRAWLRRRRGCCPCCGYNLRGNFEPGCPECGWNRAQDSAPSQ